MMSHIVKHIGDRATGSDSVDSNPFAPTVLGQDGHKRLNRALGAGVNGMFGHDEASGGVGAGQDDAAAGVEVLVGFARDEELASRVDVEDAVEFFRSHFFQVPKRHDAGVGADDVECAEMRDGFGEETHRFVDVADVGADGDGVGPERFDLLYDLVGRCCCSRVIHDNLGSLPSELDGNRGSNASPGASHQGDLAIQAEWHVWSFQCTHGAHCDECFFFFFDLEKRQRGKDV